MGSGLLELAGAWLPGTIIMLAGLPGHALNRNATPETPLLNSQTVSD